MNKGEKKEGKGQGGRRWWLLLCAIAGVALVLLGNGDWVSQKGRTDAATADASVDPLTAYTMLIEQKIATLIGSVQGVDRVTVVVTLEGDFTYVYATDTERSERDGVLEEQTQYVTVGSGSNEETVLLTRRYPRVCGIGIVCQGGGDATVRREILSLLSATYGLPTNQIYITEAK